MTKRRWPKRLAWGLLGFLGLLVLLGVGAYGYLTSKASAERLRGLAIQKVNAAIQGTLGFQRSEYSGNRLVLYGVTLKDPEGEVVAEIEELEVQVGLGELFHQRIDLSKVRIHRPRLYLLQDERGLNLARAVAPRNPAKKEEPAPGEEKGSTAFSLDRLVLEHGDVQLVQEQEGEDRVFRLQDLNGQGSASMTAQELKASLKLGGSVTEPVEGPLQLELRGDGRGEHRTADVSLVLAGAELKVKAVATGTADIDVEIERLAADPKTVAAFVPGYPLQAPVSLQGRLSLDGTQAAVKLEAQAGSSRATVDGSADIAKKRSDGITIALRHVDFAELLPQGPRSDVQLDLTARGGGTSLETLAGEVHLSVPQSTMAGHALGPVRLDASARGGEYELSRLFAQLPGVTVEGSGKGNREQLAVDLRIDAKDLATFSKTVGKLARAGGLPLSGSGKLKLSAKGPVRHPALSLDARFPRLRYQEQRFSDLALTARSPDGRAFSLAASAKGELPVTLSLSGTLDEDSRGGRLAAFSLSYPEATWKLDAPFRVSMRGAHLSVSPFRLRSGRQMIALEADKRGERLKAAVGISHLDLARLPKVFVNPDWKLAGHLDADVRADGTTSKPLVQARLGLRGGRFKTYSKLALDLDASYVKERARGTLKANGVGAKLNADFDVPVSALKERRREPVHLKATIAELRLDDSLRELGIDKPIHGFVSADVELSGTADDPRLKLLAQGRQLKFQQLPPADVRLGVQSEEDAKLGLRLDITTLDKPPSRVELKTPFTLARLIQRPPTEEQLMSAPIRLEADVRELPVPVLYAAGVMDKEVLGVLTVRGDLEGPVLAPVGKLNAVLKGASAGSPAPVDLVVDLDAAKERLRLTAQALQGDRRLLEARATVEAPPAKLRSVKSLARVPLAVDADVGPVALGDIQQFTSQPPAPGENRPPLVGTLKARIEARGTLREPKISVRSTVEGLGTPGSPTGNVAMSYEYASAKSVLDLALQSAGGKLQVAGSMDADLSYPAVTRPGALKRAGLKADLSANGFDPAFLSGISEKVKQVGGKLHANAELRGTLGAPKLQGDIEWVGGVLALQGNGDYRDIHLRLSGDQDRIELQDLSVKSGKGTAKLVAMATRVERLWSIHARGDLDRFPIVTEDQLLATVSLRTTAEGQASGSRIEIRSQLPEAHVELPDVRRKDLQKLDEPKDIVLVRNGKPIRKQKEAAGGGAGVGGSGSAGGGQELVVLVDAPRNLWVKGRDVNAEVGLSEGFRVEYGTEPLLFGAIQVLRGRVDVFGRRFDVANNSRVRFTGPVLKPDVDLTADHRNEREGVTVHLKVAGQGESLQITPTSDPPLSESEIYTLLATGRRTLRHGTGASSPTGQAASLLGSLAASQLKKTLSSKLPLDVLSIEAGDQGLEGTKLEAGAYVNDRLYVGFSGRIGADPMRGENANAVKLEYQLSKRWSLEAEYGDAKAGGADLMWGKEY